MPLRWLLTGAIGGLVLASLIISLWLGLGVASKNTQILLTQTTYLIRTMVVQRTEQYLYPAEEMTHEVAKRIGRGEFDISNEVDLANGLSFAIAAAPQLNAAAYADFDGWVLSVFREEDGTIGREREEWLDQPPIVAAMESLRQNPAAGWGKPIYSEGAKTTLLYFGSPVVINGELKGVTVATIRVEALSSFVAQIDQTISGTGFILIDDNIVLAHRELPQKVEESSHRRPLPQLRDIDDPFLKQIWSEGWEERQFTTITDGHWARINDREVYFIFEELVEDRAVPWKIGAYFIDEDVNQEYSRLRNASILSIVTLIIAIGGAFYLAHKLARPATEFAAVSKRIRNLDLDQINPLPRSKIREIDDAAGAFNSMVIALRSFARYSPRALVQRIISTDQHVAGQNEVRQMSIMFTDLAGFTSIAEELDAASSAAYLNDHFSMLTDVIEAHGGTVDKFMGDGVMAFWGAPERQSDHADRALAAAVAIAEAHIALDCIHGPRLGMRIGVHSGDVMVGDLGPPSRMNYTVVGDPVNTAHRLQTMGKAVSPDAEAIILASEDCVDLAMNAPSNMRPIGIHHIRGRAGAIQVFVIEVSSKHEASDRAGTQENP